MQNKHFTIQRITLMAVLVAMQILLARFLGITVSDSLRISFEIVPILLGGIWLGPVAGGTIGLVSDILGTVLSGFPYFPPLSITPILNGVLSGLLFNKVWKQDLNLPRTIGTVVPTEIIASWLAGTWALTLYFSMILGKDTPFLVLLAGRIPAKLPTMIVDTLLVWLIHRQLYRPVILPMLNRGASR